MNDGISYALFVDSDVIEDPILLRNNKPCPYKT